MTKKENLQALADKLKKPEHYTFLIEYKPFQGWYAVPDEARCIGDDGEYLGSRYGQAEKTLRQLLA